MDASREPGEITRLLFELKGGNPSVEPALMALVYDELRRMARNLMRRERPNHTLQTTALVHEAYLRLVDQKTSDWQDRCHFFAVAATTMRRILVDFARQKGSLKRGAGAKTFSLDDGLVPDSKQSWDGLLDLNEALRCSAQSSISLTFSLVTLPRKARNSASISR